MPTGNLEDMSLEAVVEAIEGNIFALFKSFGALPGAEIHDEDDALTFLTGINSPMFNGVGRTRFSPEGDLQDKIEETLAPFKARGVPMFWWTGPATEPLDLDEQLVEYGLAVNMVDTPGMAVDLSTLAAHVPSPSDLKIERVKDARTLKEWSQAFNRSYAAPDFAGEAWVTASTLLGLGPDLPWTLYLGRIGREAVAVSMLFLGAGVAGLYAVGTVPEVRGHGIGSAITLAPLLDARQMGYSVGILHSSDLALNMYTRMGFQEYCKVNRYTLP